MPRLLLSALLLLAAYGCAGLRTAGPEGGLTPGAVGRTGALTSISARAVVELENDTTARGRAAIAALAPDRFRIEVFGPIGQVVATLVSDGERLMVYSGGERRLYRWDDPDLPYAFTAAEVVDLLTGAQSWGQAWQADGDDNPGDRHDAGALYGGASGYRTEADPSGRISAVVKYAGARVVMRAGMGDYRDAGGAELPYSLTIDDGAQRIRISYTSVDIAPRLLPETFRTGLLP